MNIINKELIIKYLPLILFVFCFLTRVAYYDFYPVQLDEPFTIFTSGLNWAEFWPTFKIENNPPLHFLLVKSIITFFGYNHQIMRMLSVLLSSLSIIFIYKTLNELIQDWKISLFSSLIFLFSNIQVSFSHQIRAYALLVFLSSLTLYFFIKFIKEQKKSQLVYFTISSILLLYTHFMGMICVAIIGSSIIFFYKNAVLRNRLFLSFGMIFLALLPYLSIIYGRYVSYHVEGSWQEPPTSLMNIYYSIWRNFNMPFPTICFLILLAVGLIFYQKLSKNTIIFLWFFMLGYVGLFFLAFKIPIYIGHYLMFLSPFVCVLYGLLMRDLPNEIKKSLPKFVLISFIPICMIFTFNIKSDIGFENLSDWKYVIPFYKKSIVVIEPGWKNKDFCFHADKDLFYVNSAPKYDQILKKSYIYDYQYLKSEIERLRMLDLKVVVFHEELNLFLEEKFVKENMNLEQKFNHRVALLSFK